MSDSCNYSDGIISLEIGNEMETPTIMRLATLYVYDEVVGDLYEEDRLLSSTCNLGAIDKLGRFLQPKLK